MPSDEDNMRLALAEASAAAHTGDRPPVGRDACERWVLDRLIAAGSAQGDPLRASEVDLLLRPVPDAPAGHRFERWLRRRLRKKRLLAWWKAS